jgi:hypothetical protein
MYRERKPKYEDWIGKNVVLEAVMLAGEKKMNLEFERKKNLLNI